MTVAPLSWSIVKNKSVPILGVLDVFDENNLSNEQVNVKDNKGAHRKSFG